MRISSALAVLLALGLSGTAMSQQSDVEVQPPSEIPTQPSTFGTPGDTAEQSDPLRERPMTDAAQQREANFRGNTANRSGQESSTNDELVNYLAAKLYLANQCQVEMAKMAADKADHQQVKQYAQKLQKQHQQLNQKLAQAMPELKSIQQLSFASNESSATSSQFGSNQPIGRTGADRQRDALTANSSNARGDDFLDGAAQTLIDIQRRAIENNHELTKQMLSEKQGKKFDQCFVAAEMGAQMWLHSELKAIQDTGPGQFTDIVSQAEQTVKQQLDSTKQLAKTLEQQSDSRTSSTTSDADDRLSQN